MENFNEWKALGYLKSYPFRKLKLYMVDHLSDFIKPIDPEVKEYDRESDLLMDQYIKESEEFFMNQIPF